MFLPRSSQFRQSFKASVLALYLIANIAGLVALTQDWSPQDTVSQHLCVGHLSLLTNVTPDIRC